MYEKKKDQGNWCDFKAIHAIQLQCYCDSSKSRMERAKVAQKPEKTFVAGISMYNPLSAQWIELNYTIWNEQAVFAC